MSTYQIQHAWRTPLFQQILGSKGYDFGYQEVDNAVQYAVEHVALTEGYRLFSSDDAGWNTQLEEHALRYLDLDVDDIYDVGG